MTKQRPDDGRALERKLRKAQARAEIPLTADSGEPADAEALRTLIRLQQQQITLLEQSLDLQRQRATTMVKLQWRLAGAILRRLYLPDVPLSDPRYLNGRRFGLYSQNEEDGIILAIVEALGVEEGTCAEICAGVNGGNAGFLIHELGWSGLLVDGDPAKVAECAVSFEGTDAVVVQAWVTAENINTLLTEHGFDDPDYVGIDIDGNDYWLWDALACRPRLVVCEYNSLFGADAAVTVPYDPAFRRHGGSGEKRPKGYFGASLPALVSLGRRKGYRLVAVERRGVNAFFLRQDAVPELPEVDVRRVFRRKQKGGAASGAFEDPCTHFARLGAPLLDVG